MPVLRPDLSDVRLDALPARHRAEAKFYRACRKHLPERMLVYYSVLTLNERMEEGEADFVLFDPDRGMLVVEVKGGGVSFDPVSDIWQSRDHDGNMHKIRDPFLQARSRCHDLERYLAENERFKKHVSGKITAAHAVFFPDLSSRQVSSFNRPDAHPSIIGSSDDLTTLEGWVSRAFDAWQRADHVKLGKQGRNVVEAILRGPVDVRPLLSATLRDEEEVRIRLTEQQAQMLELLDGRRRIAICGGAGTGKTLLAMTRAERLAEAGRTVLLLCYNRALSDHLKDVAGENSRLHPQQIHQFCEWWTGTVFSKYGRNLLREADEAYPGKDRFHHQLPYALMLALDEYDPPSYTDVIVDEGQDFTDDEWTAVMSLVARIDATLCIFFDHNQSLYDRAKEFPIRGEQDTFSLSRNCRNTTPIHQACYRFYSGPETTCPPIKGEPVTCMSAHTLAEQARLISEKVGELHKEEVSPDDIVVLVLGAESDAHRWYQTLEKFRLPAGLRWIEKTHRQKGTVLVDTVARFKGLERMIVFLWLGTDIDANVHRELIYVGMSRAKGRLFLVGTSDACQAAKAGPRNNT